MEDDTLVMGSTFPAEVTVYLPNPRAFFETMHHDHHDATNNNRTKTASSHYFAKRGNRKVNNNHHHKKILPVSEAAFQLLQWAHYGNVPNFQTNAQAPNDTDNDQNNSEKLSSDETNSDSVMEDEEEEEEDTVELDEDAFENGDEEEGRPIPNVMNDCVEQTLQSWSATLPETDEPQDFLVKNVRLRSYQKQALHFMMER
jgi:hypothetical protein